MFVRTLLVASLGVVSAYAQCPRIHVFGARETTAPPGFGASPIPQRLPIHTYY
ncbi:hypothetical protein EXIGLDRAFT_718746 [Exidia glandulosa HHB12029]|uniref:Uncharacterized protein n=1 Tax=Exidia glandulosa HHB12029 TaxID=1314781 RepID=A0A166AHZ5_EXIGL|nr:hypothetical protein EXIGLDRAFT_718746 [Exidia glandulosa HHB12029]